MQNIAHPGARQARIVSAGPGRPGSARPGQARLAQAGMAQPCLAMLSPAGAARALRHMYLSKQSQLFRDVATPFKKVATPNQTHYVSYGLMRNEWSRSLFF